jgi:pimeloyl-ACP methyl ester carboxylesterase
MLSRTRRTAAQAVRGLTLLGLLVGGPALAASGACQDSRIPVALAPGLPRQESVAARLCVPEGPPPATVQVLVHGITYTRRHWDFPDPSGGTARYSYVSAALDAGFATLAVDRLGAGESSRPLGALVTPDTNAYVLHQVLQALRAGRVPGPAGPLGFQKVVYVGHSYGSFIGWAVASDYPEDVDAVILSGVSHTFRLLAPATVALPLWPAALDPAFQGQGYDATYLTTVPGSREATFYAPGPVDPAVVALDERTKSTLTAAEFAPFPLVLARPLDIRVPVLLVNGTEDTLFCGPTPASNLCQDAQTLRATEGPRLGARVPCLDAWVLPGAGHVLNTVPGALRWFAVAQAWVTQRVGVDPGPAPGCGP